MAEDVVQGFIRGQDPGFVTGHIHLGAEIQGDVGLVVATARVASVLILARRAQADGEAGPRGFEHLIDSQGFDAILETAGDAWPADSYSYAEAVMACHKAHQESALSDSLGLVEYEQNLWLRVLITTRNQVSHLRNLLAQYVPHHVLVEGDLDYRSHDSAEDRDYWILGAEDREMVPPPGQGGLKKFCVDHLSRLRGTQGPERAAGRRFDVMLASYGNVSRVHLIEFKSTSGKACPDKKYLSQMKAYEDFLKRYATSDYGSAELKHVSSMTTPSDVACACQRLEH
ncbi:hypothetical protein ACUN7V_20255 [Quadrisphaera oryzae]|uniref:hypothetical protein n=1 Tax=Quadrisphaera TaxID=317661 RepID=UPI0016477028|nr:hypothetical protein [Quadrisphaera sp. RL12-1S]MBC3763436.1 hypothetical protein [Quadrisphaera sp. RL12-1S]